jgi:hypothetical protein
MAVEVTSEALARAGEEGPYSKGRIITSLHFAVVVDALADACDTGASVLIVRPGILLSWKPQLAANLC